MRPEQIEECRPALTERDVNVFTAARIVANTDEMTRPEWLDLRRSIGIGGSDVAALLGISPWSSPYALWLDKTGRADNTDQSSTRLRAGTFLEPFVISEAELKHPELHVSRAPYLLTHPDHRELFVDVDGFASSDLRRARGGFEAKTTEQMMAHHWTDGVPAFYETQAFHSLAVTGLAWWMVAVMIGFSRIETYVIERDEEVIGRIVDAELAWWQRHIIEGEEPIADGSSATTAALSTIQARAGKSVELVDVAEVEGMFRQLDHDTTVQSEIENSVSEIKNRLRQIMGDATELVGPDGKTWATWRENKSGVRSLRTTPGLNLVKAVA